MLATEPLPLSISREVFLSPCFETRRYDTRNSFSPGPEGQPSPPHTNPLGCPSCPAPSRPLYFPFPTPLLTPVAGSPAPCSLHRSAMAPARKGSSRVTKTNSLRSRKLASFLKDFDREGKGRSRCCRDYLGQSRGRRPRIHGPFTRRMTRVLLTLPPHSANTIQANSVRQAEPPQGDG